MRGLARGMRSSNFKFSDVRRAAGDDGNSSAVLGKGTRRRFPRATEPPLAELAAPEEETRHCVTRYEHALPFLAEFMRIPRLAAAIDFIAGFYIACRRGG